MRIVFRFLFQSVRSFGGTPLRCLLMVITQQAAQSVTALNMPVAAGVCTPREQQDIALPLVIPLSMEVFDIFSQRASQRLLTKENHLGQALLLHRPQALRQRLEERIAACRRRDRAWRWRRPDCVAWQIGLELANVALIP